MAMNLQVTSFMKRSIPSSMRTSKLLPSPRAQPEREGDAESRGHQAMAPMTIKFQDRQWYIPPSLKNPVLISNSQFTLSHIDHSPVD